jgi:hypothetical protein
MKMVMNTLNSRLIQTSSFMKRLQGNLNLEGLTSIRVKGAVFRPIVIFGQDESAFHKYLLKAKNWRGPKGETALLPKSDGIAVMVSSRDTGFGLHLDSMNSAKINFSRQGKKYVDEAAAMINVLNNAEKQDQSKQ